jgi:peptidoglycan/xylan/chitin deacetylase (PgdA/CDA1 family)
VVPLAEALHDLAAGRRLPARAMALTFDDGYRDNVEIAVPILQRLRLPATFFLVPAMLSGEVHAWWELLAWAVQNSSRAEVTWGGRRVPLESAEQRHRWFDGVAEQLKAVDRTAREQAVAELVAALVPAGTPSDRMFLDWDGARELVRAGFTVGSHSRFHAILARETPEEQRRDLAESRRALERELQVPVELLAYPNGRRCDYNADTISAARQAGYSFALTTLDGHNRPHTPPYEIRRSCIWPHYGLLGVAAATRHMARH